MGGSSSTEVLETKDIVGKNTPQEVEDNESSIVITYGPNIIGNLLGFDVRSEQTLATAEALYDHISRPSNKNKDKSKEAVSVVFDSGMKAGQSSINFSEIEQDIMYDVRGRVFDHQQKFGVKTMEDANEKFSFTKLDSICNDMKLEIEKCLSSETMDDGMGNKASEYPFYDRNICLPLGCITQMNNYELCVQRHLSGLYS